jgi:signal transduction histidine kinase
MIIDFEADPSLNLAGDRARLVQALGNLVSNADKFSPAGETVLLRALRGAVAVSPSPHRPAAASHQPCRGVRRADLSPRTTAFWRAASRNHSKARTAYLDWHEPAQQSAGAALRHMSTRKTGLR